MYIDTFAFGLCSYLLSYLTLINSINEKRAQKDCPTNQIIKVG